MYTCDYKFTFNDNGTFKMKKILILAVLLLMPVFTNASDYDSYIEKIIQETDLSEFDKYTNEYFSFEDTVKSFSKGEKVLNVKNILNTIINLFFKNIKSSLNTTLSILSAAILGGIILNLKNSFGKSESGEAAFYICLCIICGYGIKVFSSAAHIASVTIISITAFMNSLIPVLMSLTAMGGKAATAASINPVMFTATAVITTLIGKIIMPLIYAYTAVKITDSFAEGINLGKMGDVIYSVIKWGSGIILTVFCGVTAIYVSIMPNVDAITLKTAHFAVGNFIPVVGGILSDSVDIVIACSQLLKDAVGITGLIAIILICFNPAVKIMADAIMLNIASAVIGTVSDKRITNAVSAVAKSVTLLFSMMITVTALLVIVIALVVSMV